MIWVMFLEHVDHADTWYPICVNEGALHLKHGDTMLVNDLCWVLHQSSCAAFHTVTNKICIKSECICKEMPSSKDNASQGGEAEEDPGGVFSRGLFSRQESMSSNMSSKIKKKTFNNLLILVIHVPLLTSVHAPTKK